MEVEEQGAGDLAGDIGGLDPVLAAPTPHLRVQRPVGDREHLNVRMDLHSSRGGKEGRAASRPIGGIPEESTGTSGSGSAATPCTDSPADAQPARTKKPFGNSYLSPAKIPCPRPQEILDSCPRGTRRGNPGQRERAAARAISVLPRPQSCPSGSLLRSSPLHPPHLEERGRWYGTASPGTGRSTIFSRILGDVRRRVCACASGEQTRRLLRRVGLLTMPSEKGRRRVDDDLPGGPIPSSGSLEVRVSSPLGWGRG